MKQRCASAPRCKATETLVALRRPLPKAGVSGGYRTRCFHLDAGCRSDRTVYAQRRAAYMHAGVPETKTYTCKLSAVSTSPYVCINHQRPWNGFICVPRTPATCSQNWTKTITSHNNFNEVSMVQRRSIDGVLQDLRSDKVTQRKVCMHAKARTKCHCFTHCSALMSTQNIVHFRLAMLLVTCLT